MREFAAACVLLACLLPGGALAQLTIGQCVSATTKEELPVPSGTLRIPKTGAKYSAGQACYYIPCPGGTFLHLDWKGFEFENTEKCIAFAGPSSCTGGCDGCSCDYIEVITAGTLETSGRICGGCATPDCVPKYVPQSASGGTIIFKADGIKHYSGLNLDYSCLGTAPATPRLQMTRPECNWMYKERPPGANTGDYSFDLNRALAPDSLGITECWRFACAKDFTITFTDFSLGTSVACGSAQNKLSVYTTGQPEVALCGSIIPMPYKPPAPGEVIVILKTGRTLNGGTGFQAKVTCSSTDCTTYTCPGGRAPKGGTACVGTPPVCDDATCCDAAATCGDGAGYMCSAGFQQKAGFATISCGFLMACNDATCCDAEVKCGDGAGHMCSAGFQQKTGFATIVCDGMPPVCNDATCCDAEVKCGDGAGHMCSAGFQQKTGFATIVCDGMPPVCNDATCCDAEVKCERFACSPGFQDKISKPTIVCSGMPPSCDDSTCCDAAVKCGSYTCTGGKQDKADKATILCPGMPPSCDDTTCCDDEVKCASFTCVGGKQDKADKSAILCVGMPPSCDDATCCDDEVTCGTFSCLGGKQDKPSKTAILCLGMPPSCDAVTCCDDVATCATYECSPGFQAKSNRVSVLCEVGVPPACDDVTCCDPVLKCLKHVCSASFRDRDRKETIPCAGIPAECDDATCCSRRLNCSSFPCPSHLEDKNDKESIFCNGVSCDASSCCGASVPSLVASARDTPTSGLSVSDKADIKTVTDVGGAAAIFTGNAGKLALVKNFGCLMDDVDLGDDPLDWEFHPTQAAFGSTRGKFFFAALVLNPILVAGFAFIAVTVAVVIKLCLGCDTEKALGGARAPGVVYLVHIFLLQGTSLVAAQVCFAPAKYDAGVIVLSWVLLVACVASPGVVYYAVLRRVPLKSVVMQDPAIYGDPATGKPGKRQDSGLYKFFFGTAIWVSDTGYFSEKYGVVFENLRGGCLWYVTAESLVIVCLSLLSAFKPASLAACNIRNFTIAFLLLAFFVACLVQRPFIAPMDNLIAAILSFLMAVAVLTMAVAIAAEADKDVWLYIIAKWSLFLSAQLMIAKAVWDLFQYVVDIYMQRRSSARRLARDREPDLVDMYVNNGSGSGMLMLEEFGDTSGAAASGGLHASALSLKPSLTVSHTSALQPRTSRLSQVLASRASQPSLELAELTASPSHAVSTYQPVASSDLEHSYASIDSESEPSKKSSMRQSRSRLTWV